MAESFIGTIHAPVSAGLAGSSDPARHPAEPSTSRAAAAPTPGSAGLAGSSDPARHHGDDTPSVMPSSRSSSGRQFRAEWMSKYPFLDYHADRVCVTCRSCCSAVGKDLVRKSDFRETAFLSGFRNWKKALYRFAAHAKSEAHLKAAENWLCLLVLLLTRLPAVHKRESRRKTEPYIRRSYA